LLTGLKAINKSEDLSVGGMIILKEIVGKWGCTVWIGLIWLRVGAGGRGLVNRAMTIRVPYKQVFCRPAEPSVIFPRTAHLRGVQIYLGKRNF
jgi:hypothetical protein